MSKAEAGQSVFRIIRVVKTVQGNIPGGAAAGAALGMATTGANLMMTLAALNPAGAALLILALANQIAGQYYQSNLGRIVFPDNIYRPWEYVDKVRRLTLERLYGTEKGDIVWNHEWSQRAIEIDYRSRAP